MTRRFWQAFLAAVGLSLCAILGFLAFRLWPPPPPEVRLEAMPIVWSSWYQDYAVLYPSEALIAELHRSNDELASYFYFDYLRSRRSTAGKRVVMTVDTSAAVPTYVISMEVPNDVVRTVAYLSDLKAKGLIPGFALHMSTAAGIERRVRESELFASAFQLPVRTRLEDLDDRQVISPLSAFVRFKSQMDLRSRADGGEGPRPLTREQGLQLAADMVSVSRFYEIPIDHFLGIGAMENNYLSVNGDLELTAWKRRAEPGDVVLKRRKGKVLVANFSLGRWQITRETLRYAHHLYTKDLRDYSLLPERLRPPAQLDINHVDPDVLTTYAGLIFRDLLDHFEGDVHQAVGAYNGGTRNPNAAYAEGAAIVGKSARTVIESFVASQCDPTKVQAQAIGIDCSLPPGQRELDAKMGPAPVKHNRIPALRPEE